MKAKVNYDSKFGFRFTSQTNVPRAITILSSALGEEVEVTKICFICGDSIEAVLMDASICNKCQERDDAYDLYMMQFAKLMENI